MTTGRINQVTILTAGDGATRRDPPEEGGQSSSPEVGRTATSPGPEVPRAKATQVPPGHPVSPTEFPRGRSAIQTIGLPQAAVTE
jgi:hypothetical protein